MLKHRIAALLFLCSSLIFSFNVEAAETRTIDLSSQAVNNTPLSGPEGILLAPDSNLYVGEHDGRVRRVTPEGNVEEFANLNDMRGDNKERLSAIGLAMDKEGDIYAAGFTFNTGTVYKIIGPGKEEAGQVSLFRKGIGSANFILIDDENGMMYVTNSHMSSGCVYGFDMTDESRIGDAVNAETELLGEFGYANGLALGPEKKWLYVAETTKGRISRIDLATKKAEIFADIGGWADGLMLSPDKQALYACENRGGRIVALDFSGAIIGDVRVTGKEGQCAPACLVFRDPETIVFTDLWKASIIAALLKMPKHHSYIYQISVDDVLK